MKDSIGSTSVRKPQIYTINTVLNNTKTLLFNHLRELHNSKSYWALCGGTVAVTVEHKKRGLDLKERVQCG